MADARRETVDELIGRSLLAAESLSAELRRRIIRRLSTRAGTIQEKLAQAREMLEEAEPLLAIILGDSELAAWIAGNDFVFEKLPDFSIDLLADFPRVQPELPTRERLLFTGEPTEEPLIRFPLIERAAEELLERNVLTRPEYDRQVEAVRQQTFTVARQSSEETIGRIRDVLVDTIGQGASLEAFRQKLGPALEASFIGPHHLENVYRTNIQTAFHRAMDEMASDPIASEIFPYMEILPIDDSRTRENHLALATLGLSGTGVYRRDDPFWNLFLPPWEWQCRCGTNLLTIEAAARKGVVEARTWLRTGIPPAAPEWRLDDIPFRPDPEFTPVRQRAA